MISSYNSIPQTVAENGLLTFDTNRIVTGCTVEHTAGSTTFKLSKPGYYYVTFNAVVTGAAAATIQAQLQNETVVVPGAVAAATITDAAQVTNLSFATIVKVLPSCCAIDNTIKLSIINNADEGTYNVANLNITKLC